MRDHACPTLFANGKGASQLAARASALGEFLERFSTHYFWAHSARTHASRLRWNALTELLQGRALHQTLLTAYDKLFAESVAG